MDRHCPRCHKTTNDDHLVRCPTCYCLFDAPPIGELVLSPSQEAAILRKLKRSLLTWVYGSFALVGGFTLLLTLDSIKGVAERAVNYATDKARGDIDALFQEPRIREIVVEVAKTESEALLRTHVQPSVVTFEKKTEAAYTSFKTLLNSREDELRRTYETIRADSTKVQETVRSMETYTTGQVKRLDSLSARQSQELKALERRTNVLGLGANATTGGDRVSFDALVLIANDNKNEESISNLARGEMYRVKAFWLMVSTIGGKTLLQEGKQVSPSELKTCALIEGLQSKDSAVRVMIARELARRRERPIPEVLINLMDKDPHLEVVKSAVSSFGIICSYTPADVFGGEYLRDYWRKNMQRINAELKDSGCHQ